MSKGSKQRPTNHVNYASNYDKIFGTKYPITNGVRGLVEDTSNVIPMMEPALDFTDSIQPGDVA